MTPSWKRWLVDWTNAVMSSDLSSSARLVAFVLARKADNRTGKVELKRKGRTPRAVLADLTGLSEATVTRALRALLEAELITRTKRGPLVDYTLLDATGSRHGDAIQGSGSPHGDAIGSPHPDNGSPHDDAVGSRHGEPPVCSRASGSVSFPPDPPGGGGRRKEAWEETAGAYLAAVLPDAPPTDALKALRQAKSWHPGVDNTETFLEFVGEWWPQLLPENAKAAA